MSSQVSEEFKLLTKGIFIKTKDKSLNTPKNISGSLKLNQLSALENSTHQSYQVDSCSQKDTPISQQQLEPPYSSLSDAALRKKLHIHVKSLVRSPLLRSFDDLVRDYNFPRWILDALYTSHTYLKFPTPVQMQTIPFIIKKESIIVTAPTGSGKTLAYLLPLVALLEKPSRRSNCRALILLPTRELAMQTAEEFSVLTQSKKFKYLLFHKVKDECPHHDVGITTPLKLIQLLKEEKANLNSTEYIVVDEADRLLDSGFAPQLDKILTFVPPDHLATLQYIFLSATMQGNARELINSVVINPTSISIGAPMSAATNIQQQLVCVTNESGKLTVFRQLIASGKIAPPTLIFVQTIERAQQLFQELVFDGYLVGVIHAGRPKSERNRIVEEFRAQKRIWILICTDLISRGIDFKGIQNVISWDLPQSATAYIHRIGRTGRAGHNGMAITFFTLDDIPYIPQIIGVMRQSGCEIPEWLQKIPKLHKKKKKMMIKHGLKRRRISTQLINNKLKQN